MFKHYFKLDLQLTMLQLKLISYNIFTDKKCYKLTIFSTAYNYVKTNY